MPHIEELEVLWHLLALLPFYCKGTGPGGILDPKLCPKHSITSAQLLFSEQLSFMFSVLIVTLQNERGKALSKEFEDDTQKILVELHGYDTKSEMAQHEIVELTGFYPKLKSFWSCSHMNCCLH